MHISRESHSPDLHICPATSQVFNRTAYNQVAEKQLGKLEAASEVLRFQSMMTVGQLLEYSPSADDVINKCFVRRPEKLAFFYLEREECRKAFQVKKYYTLEYICYNIALVPLDGEPLYNNYRLNLAINYPGVYYELTLDDRWQQSLNNFRVLSIQRQHGDESLSVAPILSRGLGNGSALYDFFRVSNYKIHYHRLPPPYDTKCHNYTAEGVHSATDCENRCMNKRSLSQVNLFWYGSRAYYPLDQRPLSSKDFLNETLAKIVNDISSHCQRACSQAECHVTWAITRVRNERQQIGITFSAVAPKRPSFYIFHEAQQTFESYVIFAMSCIGSWFGLSALSFNPVAFMAGAPWRARGDRKQNGYVELGADAKKVLRYLMSLMKDMNHMKCFVKSHLPAERKRRNMSHQRYPRTTQSGGRCGPF
ncbi:hypothetical protein HDE_01916 [Halotydeus destructor]|nr:hypothetical protein HDE_01916 [Halotydeus destructor]